MDHRNQISPKTIIDILGDCKWAKPTQTALEPLDDQEGRRFEDILTGLGDWLSDTRGVMTFRGQKKAQIADWLVPRRDGARDLAKVFSRLFFVGEKGRYFLPADAAPAGVQHLNDDSPPVFRFIAKALGKLAVKPGPEINFARRIFRQENPEFGPLVDETGRREFCELCSRQDPNDRQRLRDYYFYLLHTVGNKLIKDVSFFVSTSRDIRIAENFARSSNKDDAAVILFYWLPNPIWPHAFDRQVAAETANIASRCAAPRYREDLYPFQDEISVRGALFPHFMLGAYDLEDGRFIVNPHLLPANARSLPELFADGAEIDHQRFREEIRQTGYHKFVARYGERYCDQPV